MKCRDILLTFATHLRLREDIHKHISASWIGENKPKIGKNKFNCINSNLDGSFDYIHEALVKTWKKNITPGPVSFKFNNFVLLLIFMILTNFNRLW